MKQNKDPMGLDYYRLYLIRHLREHYFPQFTNEKFVTARTEDAYDTFVTLLPLQRQYGIGQIVALPTMSDPDSVLFVDALDRCRGSRKVFIH